VEDSVQSPRLAGLAKPLDGFSGLTPQGVGPLLLPLPWRASEEYQQDPDHMNGGLAFGMMKTDGIATPHPPIARALRIVAVAMQEAGHEVSLLLKFQVWC